MTTSGASTNAQSSGGLQNAAILQVLSLPQLPLPPYISSKFTPEQWRKLSQQWKSSYAVIARLAQQPQEYQIAMLIACLGPGGWEKYYRSAKTAIEKTWRRRSTCSKGTLLAEYTRRMTGIGFTQGTKKRTRATRRLS